MNPKHALRRDSRYDDTAEVCPHFEFFDKAESSEFLARAPAQVTVIKVLPLQSVRRPAESNLRSTLTHMATGTSISILGVADLRQHLDSHQSVPRTT